MNSHIVPVGPTETITNGTIAGRPIEIVQAETDCVITSLIYQFPATPPNAGVVNAFTLKAGRYLFKVASLIFTGTATIIYEH
jgi:hypothetical protein